MAIVRGFLVERGTPGFKTWDVHGKLSLRASVTSGLAFTDCEIPADNMLPGVEGLRGPLSCLTQARYGIGWGAIGAAMACYQTALRLREDPQAISATSPSPRTSSCRTSWSG